MTGSWKDNVFSAEASFEIAEKLHCNLIMYFGYSHAVYDEAPDFKLNIKYFFDN